MINYLAKDTTTLLPSCEDRTLFDLGVMGVKWLGELEIQSDWMDTQI